MNWRRLIDVRRLVVAAPLLAAMAVAAWFLIPRGTGSTPHAVLAQTPPEPGMQVGVRRGQLARDFIARAPDGSQIRLSDLRGKPTVINFWATWCSSCVAELPDLKAVQQSAGTDKLNVVAVNAGEDNGAASAFLRRLDAKEFRIGMDPTLVVADAYGVSGLPMSVFVDSNGVIRATYSGQLTKDLMRQYVQAASAGDTAPSAPPRIRLVTTVARDHVLEGTRVGAGEVRFVSKSLRCDDSYCSDAALAGLSSAAGVTSIDRHLGEDPPRIVVHFDASVTNVDALANALRDELNAHPDPLYERPLTVHVN